MLMLNVVLQAVLYFCIVGLFSMILFLDKAFP